MRTSKEQRKEEWSSLNLKACNGRLTQWPQIKRWQVLRQEFQVGLEKVGKLGVNGSITDEND